MAIPSKRFLSLFVVGLLMASSGFLILTARPASALTPHAPIYFFTDSAFSGNPAVSGGNGTAGNPYIIEGWDINASTGIGIHLIRTNAFVLIRNLSVHDGDFPYGGIYLDTSKNVRVENVTLTKNDYGVSQYSGGPLKVRNSTLVNNDYGVRVNSAPYTDVNSTYISGGYWGVYLDHSSYANITYNNISGSTLKGIYTSFDTNTKILGNTIHDNQLGIQLNSARNDVLRNNSFTNDGLHIQGATVLDFATHTITTDNLVNGKPLYYMKNSNSVVVNNIPVGEIILANTTRAKVSNISVSGTDIGAGIYFSTGGWVNDSSFSFNNRYGVDLYYGSGVNILRSTIDSNYDTGMFLGSASNVTLRHDSFVNNTWNGLIMNYATGTVIDNNNFSYSYYGTASWNSGFSTITSNQVWNNTYGVYLSGGTGSVIGGNWVSTNFYGLWLDTSINLTLRDNNISYNNEGAYITGGSGAQILRNSAFSNAVFGLSVTSSTKATFRDNRVVKTLDAIVVYSADRATVTNNTVQGNNRGIFVYNSAYSSINGNNASYNSQGLELFSANYDNVANNTFYRNTAQGVYLISSLYNRVYHNSFIANSVQAYDNWDVYNQWNLSYPNGGNFWSNYTGADVCRGAKQTDCTGPDGIGDTRFNLDGDTFDYQPLMRMPGLPNTAPKAAFTYSPSTIYTTTMVTLDANPSWDYEDAETALQVRWDFTNDGTWDTSWSTVKTTTRQYSQVGTYAVKLEVRDAAGLASNTTKTLSVALPPVVVTLQVDHPSGQVPLTVGFTSNITSGTAPYAYAWNFGDGSSSTQANPEHTYVKPGIYNVTLTVTDANGKVDTQYTTVTVAGPGNPPPGGPLLGFDLTSPITWIILGGVVAGIGLAVGLAKRKRRRPKAPTTKPPVDDLNLLFPPTR